MSVGEKVVVEGVKINFDVLSLRTMYIAPPLAALQLLNEREFNVRVFDAGMLTYIAPPLPCVDSDESNVRLESNSIS